jgi:hypothetical protein
MAGFVYVMSNSGFDGRLKIGKSIKDPTKDRVEELNSTTSVPEPFKVEYYCFVEKFDKLEQEIHKRLADSRPNKRREFFQIGLMEAVATIQEIADDLGGIKFEEFYFDQERYLTPASEAPEILDPAKPEEVEFLHFSKTPIAFSPGEHPKAAKVLEYNAAARTFFDRIAKVPGSAVSDFILMLENNPNISSEELDDLFKEPAYVRHFKPFDELFADYFYGLCLQENMSMAAEFKSDFELLGNSVTARDIFKNLSKKYHIRENKYHIEGEPFFTSVSRSFSFFSEVTTEEIVELFSEINISIEFEEFDNHLYLNEEFVAITLPDDELLYRMKEPLFLLFLDAEKPKTARKENMRHLEEKRVLSGQSTRDSQQARDEAFGNTIIISFILLTVCICGGLLILTV